MPTNGSIPKWKLDIERAEALLKSCPCCDGAAEVGDLWDSIFDLGPARYCIACSCCGLRTDHDPTLEEAVFIWNRRV